MLCKKSTYHQQKENVTLILIVLVWMALIVVTMSYTMTLILKDKPVRHPAFTSGLDDYDCVGRPSFHCDHSSFDGKPLKEVSCLVLGCGGFPIGHG
jgi:hypothetical protein